MSIEAIAAVHIRSGSARLARPRHVRQWLLTLLIIASGATALMGSFATAARADDAAVEYVRRVARELIAANHAGSMTAFNSALTNHSHVQAIGTYALGTYRPNLKPTDRDTYFAGMVRFISRYAATESGKYQVASLQITGPASKTSNGVVVDSKVIMKDGQSYDVQWLLQSAGAGYRIRDAKVQVLLGDYWMTPFLKDLFEKYIAENGSVQALVVALSR